jgi:structural maintenance of chromosome 3 (chondroitin sulfate proteoglycan 6)
VVVDTAETALELVEELNRRKEGRLTFIPLNKIQGRTVKVPDSPDIVTMYEVLQFNPTLKKAFQEVICTYCMYK